MGKVQPVRPSFRQLYAWDMVLQMHARKADRGEPRSLLCIFRKPRPHWDGIPFAVAGASVRHSICCSYRAVFLCCFLFQKIQHLTSCFIQCFDRQNALSAISSRISSARKPLPPVLRSCFSTSSRLSGRFGGSLHLLSLPRKLSQEYLFPGQRRLQAQGRQGEELASSITGTVSSGSRMPERIFCRTASSQPA